MSFLVYLTIYECNYVITYSLTSTLNHVYIPLFIYSPTYLLFLFIHLLSTGTVTPSFPTHLRVETQNEVGVVLLENGTKGQ